MNDIALYFKLFDFIELLKPLKGRIHEICNDANNHCNRNSRDINIRFDVIKKINETYDKIYSKKELSSDDISKAYSALLVVIHEASHFEDYCTKNGTELNDEIKCPSGVSTSSLLDNSAKTVGINILSEIKAFSRQILLKLFFETTQKLKDSTSRYSLLQDGFLKFDDMMLADCKSVKKYSEKNHLVQTIHSYAVVYSGIEAKQILGEQADEKKIQKKLKKYVNYCLKITANKSLTK